jgi:hypothetical protein
MQTDSILLQFWLRLRRAGLLSVERLPGLQLHHVLEINKEINMGSQWMMVVIRRNEASFHIFFAMFLMVYSVFSLQLPKL